MSTVQLALKQLRVKVLKGDIGAIRQVILLSEKIETKVDKVLSPWDGDFEFTLDIGDKKVIGPGERLIEREDEQDNKDDEDDGSTFNP